MAKDEGIIGVAAATHADRNLSFVISRACMLWASDNERKAGRLHRIWTVG
jgi:hypothetical protein